MVVAAIFFFERTLFDGFIFFCCSAVAPHRATFCTRFIRFIFHQPMSHMHLRFTHMINAHIVNGFDINCFLDTLKGYSIYDRLKC